jgi:hypothetical protein
MTDFETVVLQELGEIKAAIATTAEAHRGHEFRLASLEDYNKIQDSRAWIKSIAVGIGVTLVHPIARKLGLDI